MRVLLFLRSVWRSECSRLRWLALQLDGDGGSGRVMNVYFIAELVAALVQDFDHLSAHSGTIRKRLRQHGIFAAAHGDGGAGCGDHLAIEF